MDRLLLFSVLLASFSAFATSDFLIRKSRNVRKRSTSNTVVNGIEIYSLKIDSKVTSRFAHTVINSRAVNRADVSQEAFFDVDLPKTAFITNFTMTIDGVTYPGTIKEKEVAKQQYQKAVSRGQTAGLVKASGRKTEKFTISVNIAAGSKVTFELTYEELLQRQRTLYEMFIKVKPKQLVDLFQIEVDIYEPQGLSSLEAHGTFITNDLSPVIQKSIAGNKGHVSFKPTIDQQRTCENCSTSLLDGDFVIKYDVNRESPGNVQIVNGYFVHFFAPSNLPSIPKNIIFVIDKSGSMSGRKIIQTKEALLKILDDMKEHDHFNYILFASIEEPWQQTLIKATPENVANAKKFIETIYASGGTNINDPLLMAVEMLNEAQEKHMIPERSSSMIILLTDGDANSGESNPVRIQENVKNAIKGRYPLYSLGFGHDVDYNFLEKLSLENLGVARRIYEDSDSDLQLQGFYDEVANPMLQDIELQYPENAVDDLTQKNFKNYFDGSEIVVAGRITDNDLNFFTADVKAQGADNDLTFVDRINVQEREDAIKQLDYIFGGFTERLWAFLTIQQLLKKRVSAQGDEKENLTAQALDLSLKYKFVTPLTSMVVTKPEDEKNNETLIADKLTEGEEKKASWVSQAPPYQPTYTSYARPVYSVDSDPHFILQIPEKKDAICFNINEGKGVVLNLINDPESGVVVNGQLIGDKGVSSAAKMPNTYFGKIGIVYKGLDLRIEATPQTIAILNGRDNSVFSWLDTLSLDQDGLTLIINRKKNLVVSMGDGAKFVVVLHQVWKKHPEHQDFLGFYTLDTHMFSERTHGLLGQFFHGIDFEVFDVHQSSEPGKPDATMIVKNNTLTVTRGWQKDYRKDPKTGTNVACWFVHNNGKGLIDGVHTDYIVPNILSTA
ncbi:inter-alpha-trypsin inhibitor heavy chain H3-like [Rhinatrema bivittatum]|uniref:inter-alpha-trypsin inhibitor heavy chain H3-like n=1 Tax=Rhinatrema bivittatum TaxID=194408 RepID=UPI001129B5DD|nr:inter-alpha-trypsin inhibitor heavy chain H3-like [Rhinatrema bivittatum]